MKRALALLCLLAYTPFAFGLIWIQPSRFGATVTPAWVYNITTGAASSGESTETSFSYAASVVADQTGSCTKVSVRFVYQNFGSTTLKVALLNNSGTVLKSGSFVTSGFQSDVDIAVDLSSAQAVTSGTTYIVAFAVSTSTFGTIAYQSAGAAPGNVDYSNGYSTFPLSSYSYTDTAAKYRVGLYIE